MSRGEQIAFSMEKCWVGVIYGVFICMVIVPFGYAIYVLFTESFPTNLIVGFVGVCCSIIGAGIVSLAASSIALGLVVAVNWSLSDLFDSRNAVVVFGSVSGFLASAWMLFGPISYDNFWRIVSSLLIAFTMWGGYVGAVWAGSRRDIWKLSKTSESQFQFQIKHALIAMFWFSVVMALDRLVGRHVLIQLLGIYAVVQIVLLLLDWKIRPKSLKQHG